MKLVNNCPFDENAVPLTSLVCRDLLASCSFTDIKKRYVIFIPRKGFLKKIAGIEKVLGWLPLVGQYYMTAGK